jgi:hypothetical protein
MTVLRIDRFTADPADTAELLRRRNALVAAVRAAVPGLLEARLAKLDDRHWVDMWRWDSLDNARAAATRARAGDFPTAGAAFELVDDVVTEFTEIVDER